MHIPLELVSVSWINISIAMGFLSCDLQKRLECYGSYALGFLLLYLSYILHHWSKICLNVWKISCIRFLFSYQQLHFSNSCINLSIIMFILSSSRIVLLCIGFLIILDFILVTAIVFMRSYYLGYSLLIWKSFEH